MKKLFLILFAFLFLMAFANTHNHEKTDYNADGNDDVAVMLLQKTGNSEGIYQGNGHYLCYADRQGYGIDRETGRHGDRYSANAEGRHDYNPAKQTGELKFTDTFRENRSDLYLRFSKGQSKAIRKDNKDTSLKIGAKTNTRYYKRAQLLAAHVLQYRLNSYTASPWGGNLEDHFKKI